MTHPTVEPQDAPVVADQPALPSPARKKRTRPIVLSIVAVLLVGASVTFGVLLSNETSRNNVLSTKVSDQERELSDNARRVQDNKDKVTKALDALKKATDATTKASNDSFPLIECNEAAKALRDAVRAGDIPKGRETMRTVMTAC